MGYKNGGIGFPNRILRDILTELFETDETRTKECVFSNFQGGKEKNVFCRTMGKRL